MNKKVQTATLTALLLLSLLLSACAGVSSVTQSMGDQDVEFGGHSLSVAGQLANWNGKELSVLVYSVSDDPQCKTTTTYVKPAAPFVIVSVCNNGTWAIVGTTNAQGNITAATPTQVKK